MRKLIVYSIVIGYATFFLNTTKTETIVVKSITEYSNDGNWLIHTDKGTYQVPFDYGEFNWNVITNWLILNLNAKDDFKTLSSPGTYIVRTYGNRKITEILESEDDQPMIVDLYDVAIEFINDLTRY